MSASNRRSSRLTLWHFTLWHFTLCRLTLCRLTLPWLLTAAGPAKLMLAAICLMLMTGTAAAQMLGEPDRASPGDAAIQSYLAQTSRELSEQFRNDVVSLEQWEENQPRYSAEYLYMLGLDPMPERTPLKAVVTSTYDGDGYSVEMLHYQSSPGLYVTGNLYRPATVSGEKKLPAVFYVCGHSGRGRNGNKVAFQSHGIWLARHGYVCLIVDTLQLGEIAATHHGTYNLDRWWWHSRGYTPAGVEAWNGIRGIDLLCELPYVDRSRIGVTGISGGGAVTLWIAAADPRVKVAIPVSGMADLESYVPNLVVNGHCDCMFIYNTFRWPWTRIAGLVAPRPMLFINSDQDPIFPMDANERIIGRLERIYSLSGAGNQVDSVVSVGGHAYRADIRKAAFEFLNLHLQRKADPVTDAEIDVVSEGSSNGPYPIPPERLRVFPTDDVLPKDQVNTRIDELFVPIAASRRTGKFSDRDMLKKWQQEIISELRKVSFRSIPNELRPFEISEGNSQVCATTDGALFLADRMPPAGQPSIADAGALIFLKSPTDPERDAKHLAALSQSGRYSDIYVVSTRGFPGVHWTRRNPPNYVERSMALLGTTVDTGRVHDVMSVVCKIKASDVDGTSGNGTSGNGKVTLAGCGHAAVIAAATAALDTQVDELVLIEPIGSFMEPQAPQFLNVLRVIDVPDLCGLVAPRPLTIVNPPQTLKKAVTEIYSGDWAESLVITE